MTDPGVGYLEFLQSISSCLVLGSEKEDMQGKKGKTETEGGERCVSQECTPEVIEFLLSKETECLLSVHISSVLLLSKFKRKIKIRERNEQGKNKVRDGRSSSGTLVLKILLCGSKSHGVKKPQGTFLSFLWE